MRRQVLHIRECFAHAVVPITTCSQIPAKGNERSQICPKSIHAAPYPVHGAAFSWVLLEPPPCGDSQCWSHVPSLCQMVPQTWSSPDQTSALLMSPGSCFPGTKPRGVWGRLCACPGSSPSLLILTVCTCQPDAIAVLLSPPHSRPPLHLFYPLHPEVPAPGQQLCCALLPCSLGVWHLLAVGWGEGTGQGEAGVGDQGEG